jgi:hypothetical protein
MDPDLAACAFSSKFEQILRAAGEHCRSAKSSFWLASILPF